MEQGHFDRSDPIARAAVECEFEMLRSVGIDTLLLGCTHYPMLTELILDYLGDKLELVDAGAAAGFALPGKLRQLGIEAPSDAAGTEVFYTSGDTEKFESMAHMFLGRGIKAERRML